MYVLFIFIPSLCIEIFLFDFSEKEFYPRFTTVSRESLCLKEFPSLPQTFCVLCFCQCFVCIVVFLKNIGKFIAPYNVCISKGE